jgi:hypothetical protein
MLERPHPAQVAGRFYPEDPDALQRALTESHARRIPVVQGSPKLIIAPHAGIAYSGAVAATAFAAVDPSPIRRVVVIGPAHRAAFKGIATTAAEHWLCPLGAVEVDWPWLTRALALPDVRIADAVFTGEHSLEMHLPFIRTLMPQARLVPLLVGDASVETVAAALRALWGGPETLISVSSDLSHFLAQPQARASDAATRGLIEDLTTTPLGSERACGHRVIDGALAVARDLDLRLTGIDLRTSADTVGNPDRVVGYGAFIGEYAAAARIATHERALLLRVAVAGLRHAAAQGGRMPEAVTTEPLPPASSARRATFVTLTAGGRLRGCIGSLKPQRSLAGDVIVNAVKAGFSDPRFSALEAGAINDLTVSVSILSHPRLMRFTSEADLIAQIRPDMDGLILSDGARSGLFLPSVWESLPDVRAFWRGLKGKAGLPADHWSSTLQVRRFGTESFGARAGDLGGPVPVRFA